MGLRVGVITSASAEFALSAALPGVETIRLPSAETTTFENRYLDGHRVQTLHARARVLDLNAVPFEWRWPSIVHLAPLDDEVDMQLVSSFPGAFIGVTPQGWMRQWNGSGRVSPKPWREAHAVLPRVDAVVISEEDVGGDWNLIRDWANYAPLMIVTQGPRGATMFVRGEAYHVPTHPTRELDPTGAGDIFATAFFAEMRRTGDAFMAASTATCLAAGSVTRRGLEGVPTPDEVTRCVKSQISNNKFQKASSDS